MKNISAVKNCYGCGVCATICGRKIIEIKQNADGFYEPHMTDEAKCSTCGLCLDVCAYLHDELSLKDCTINSYAAWSKDHLIRRKCSSGGAGFEIGKYLIEQGYKVCGVRYDAEKNRAEHYIASTVVELVQSAGSKYIQSYTVDGFKAIDRKEKYLVTGTPCQIDSFRRYIQSFVVRITLYCLISSAMECHLCCCGKNIQNGLKSKWARLFMPHGVTNGQVGMILGRWVSMAKSMG